jgi:hypothetical protein
MQVTCPHCSRSLDYSGEPPSFCAYCGHSLPGKNGVATVESPVEAATLPPNDTPKPADAVPVPESIGGYRLLRLIGRGGMGSVHEAEEIASGRRVAVKLISRDYDSSFQTFERFRREGRLASLITHPRCVFVLAADEEAGQPYIVMELMPGTTLQEVVDKQGPLGPSQAVVRILDVIEGLEEAHHLGVIHRDVKPSNCFVEANGRVKIGDFGLSKSLAQGAHLTRTGSFLGTPLYASPEQVRADTVDEQSDVYSVAATLYFLLTGRAPHQTKDAAATLARIVSEPAPSMRAVRPDLPAGLDEVVLRGLERQREDRWQNLSQFRKALAPFVNEELSFAGMGMRFGAYLIDASLLTVLGVLVVFVCIWLTGDIGLRLWVPEAAKLILVLAYFGSLEGLYGFSLGKLLFGLRVRNAGGTHLAGVPRSLLRAGAYFALLNLGYLVSIRLLLVYRPVTNADFQRLFVEQPAAWWGITAMPWIGTVLGLVAMFLPARARNGYRGLHEFISGTRTVSLPPSPRRRLRVPSHVPVAEKKDGLPDRVGPYVIQSVLFAAPNEKVLSGEDPALGRKVWIWLRPLDAPPLSPQRRTVDRLTRLRCLASGRTRDYAWETFVAPRGCPVPQLVRAEGRLAWADARPILEELTDELTAACGEGLLPETLSAEQVWIESSGRVKLVDVPLAAGVRTSANSNDDERALSLLAQVAVLLLEGRPRDSAGGSNSIQAPVPLHASEMLRRLMTGPQKYERVEEFQNALRATRGKPLDLTRPRRVASLGALAACVAPGLLLMFSMTWGLEIAGLGQCAEHLYLGNSALTRLREGQSRELASALAQTNPLEQTRVIVQLTADLDLSNRLLGAIEHGREEMQARQTLVHPVLKPIVPTVASFVIETEEDVQRRHVAFREFVAEEADYQNQPDWRDWHERAALLLSGFVLACPAIWICWAFATRGGLVFRLSAVSLVNAWGQRASRLRCAWRAALVWMPIGLLLVASLQLEASYWTAWTSGAARAWTPWVFFASWWASLGLVLSYGVLALWFPARGPHDRLAGTYLVPR